MFAQGIIGPQFPLSPRGGTAPHQSEPVEEIPAWNTLPADRQADLARRMALYAGMIEAMDRNLGRVIQRLEQAGELHQTLVLFLSDNGGNHEGGRFGRTGTTVNAPPLTGSDLENMGQNGQPWIYLGGGWANVNNTPFRLFKHFIHDAVVLNPVRCVHWPMVSSRTNVWVVQPSHVIDVMATSRGPHRRSYPPDQLAPQSCARGSKPPSWFNGAPILDRQIAFEHESNRGLVSGPWKLVTKNFELYDGSSPAHELELYNTAADPVELTNLAALYPARVSQMVAQWNAWAARVGVPSGRWLPSVPLNLSPAPQPGDLFLDTFARNDATI
jgi:arylsulfatase